MFKGKFIGRCAYIHKSIFENSIDLIDKRVTTVYEFFRSAIERFDGNFDIIKVDLKNFTISLIKVDDFDKWLNPIILEITTYYNTEIYSTKKYYKQSNKQIYHRKHEFVTSDYNGFDINSSIQWVKLYESSGIMDNN